jgi:tRNA (adenine57-N1/adenine58-N1)-methyltransferase
MVVGADHKWLLLRLEVGRTLQTHRGMLQHDLLIGKPWGSRVNTHLDYPFLLLTPSLEQRILRLRRNSQIVYPKESGHILLKMNIRSGARVVEAGTGSGGLTLVLAQAVHPGGRVHSYDIRADVQRLARRNLEPLGLEDVVEFKLRDIAEGFDEVGVDALFLDLPNPWEYLQQAHAALINGGFFGAILPTANQVTHLLAALEKAPFGFQEVEEVLVRPYKPVAARFRPMDRMIAHTGFLIFARTLVSRRTAESPSAQLDDRNEKGESDVP